MVQTETEKQRVVFLCASSELVFIKELRFTSSLVFFFFFLLHLPCCAWLSNSFPCTYRSQLCTLGESKML